jgi:hypothetical protein
LHSNPFIFACVAAAIAGCIASCGHDFNNPSDPANNGRFYGGVDSRIVGTWDQVTPSISRGFLVCSDTAFVFNGTNLTRQWGNVNAKNGQGFSYISNSTEPVYLFNYSLSANADTLYLNEVDVTSHYIDPSTLPNIRVFTHSP